MSDLQNFFSNLHVYWQAAIIGIAGGLLGRDVKSNSMNNIKGWRRHVSGVAASASSAFTCFIVFLIVHPVTGSEEIGLGIGGYCAWRGAEWTKTRVNQLLDRRIGQDFYYRDYSYGGNMPCDRRKDYGEDEYEYPRPPSADMNQEYKMME